MIGKQACTRPLKFTVLITLVVGIVIGWCLKSLLAEDHRADWNPELKEDQSVFFETNWGIDHGRDLSRELPPTSFRSEVAPKAPAIDKKDLIKERTDEEAPQIYSDELSLASEEELERRFGRLSLQELKGAKAGITFVVMKENRRILDEKFELGLYETGPVVNGMGPPQSSEPGKPLRPFRTRMVTVAPGVKETQTATLEIGESPFSDARMAELNWILARMHSLERPDGEDG